VRPVFFKYQSGITAIIEQESNSKPPYMHAGDPNPQTCVNWERTCKHYADNKDIPADKIVKHILHGFEDACFINWIEIDCEHFEAMALDKFMMIYTHLPANWQDDTRIFLSHMTQDPMNFWEL
jgi:hypothetical protein